MFIYHNIPLLTIVVDLLENERQKRAMPFQQVLGSPPYLQIQFFHYQFLIVLPSILVSLWDLLDAFSRFAGQNHSTGLNIPQKGPQRHLGTASSLWIKLLSTVSHFWLLLGPTLCPEEKITTRVLCKTSLDSILFSHHLVFGCSYIHCGSGWEKDALWILGAGALPGWCS